MTVENTSNRKVYRVGELTARLKNILELEIGQVWLEGEISNFSKPASGHWYFTLKDETAQIRAAFFKNRQQGMDFAPSDGHQVRVYGQLTVFERSGQYQLIIHKIEPVGQGSLHAAFEELKKKLKEEGLFDPARKKTLPMLPRCIGIVTSPTGAVIRDMITVLTRRFPNIRILLAPVKVQGDGAAKSIATAIDYFNEHHLADVLIVGRGGGSLEDLWAFNEEVVARAIAKSTLPVISAVGHETDFSISDFVADLRAPTPSAAAELVVSSKSDFEEQLRQIDHRLKRALDIFRVTIKSRFTACRDHWAFKEPTHLIHRERSRLSHIEQALQHSLTAILRERHQRVDEAALQMRHMVLIQRQNIRSQLEAWTQQLRLLNPNMILDRGYSITRTKDGKIIRQPTDVQPGTDLVTVLTGGEILSTVKESNVRK